MDKSEKILLLEVLLKDIRGNWGWEHKDRTQLARTLASDLGLETHKERIKEYCESEYKDGRHFRTSFSNGGYIGLSSLHKLEKTLQDKSKKFQELVDDYITFPKHAFDDYNG